jgi:hypothetical protein
MTPMRDHIMRNLYWRSLFVLLWLGLVVLATTALPHAPSTPLSAYSSVPHVSP